MRCRCSSDAAGAPGSRNVASCHFLTVGTLGGNSASRARMALYMGSLGAGFPEFPNSSFAVPWPWPHRAGATQRSSWNRVWPETNRATPALSPATFNKGDPKMSNQNQPGQQNQTPAQKPGQQQQGGGAKPGQQQQEKPGQQQDPNRQGQTPQKDR